MGTLLLVALVAAAATGTTAMTSEAPGAQAAMNAAPTRVRGVDQKAAWLLARGLDTSPAFATLVGEVEQSDLIVHVHAAPFRILRLTAFRTSGVTVNSGALRFVASTPAVRYLRIAINTSDFDINLIAALAHELQHAVEIAREKRVTDAAALRRFYEARGFRKADGTYCTREAIQIAALVRDEVARRVVPPATGHH